MVIMSDGNTKKIVVMGDSHTTLYSNVKERNRGQWRDSSLEKLFDIRWIGPVTYWKLCRDQKNFIDFDADISYSMCGIHMTTRVPCGHEIMIVLGEIDVRCHILKFGYENYKDTVDNMCLHIKEFLEKYGKKFVFHLQSIVPPIYRENFPPTKPLFPFVGDDSQRRDVTLYFNNKLKELSNELNIGYFNIFDLYADKNNMMILEKSDHIVHAMKTPELEKYIKEYFNHE
tara:strand:- start:626 stop:1312 length:687 start_codon:yes stop_codon:yes gene_type:complete